MRDQDQSHTLLDGQQLREVKTANGYRPLALDLTALAAVMRENWTKIESKTAVQEGELAQAEGMAERLLTAVGQREQAPAMVAASATNRQRAFTLFVRAYDEVRRAVSYLRWKEGDVEKIAPSLYAGRGAGTRRKLDSEAAVPGGTDLGLPSTSVPSSPTNGAAPAPVPSGMPGSDPFLRS